MTFGFDALGLACMLVISKSAELPRWHSLLLVLGFVFTVAWGDGLGGETSWVEPYIWSNVWGYCCGYFTQMTNFIKVITQE